MGYFLFLAAFLGSAFIVDYLACVRGWNRSRWTVAVLSIGSLAIALVYLVDAAGAVRKMLHAPRP